jgi:GT2 family glycosyltransferase
MPTPCVKASIIIVNWNGKAHLPDCLESLNAQTFKDFETILVDNGSADGSLEFVDKHYPWVKTVALPANRGFAGGNNAGYPHASGDYIIALNNDTEAEPTWLEELVRVTDENPAVGMVASRICSYDDHDVIDSLGVKVCSDGMSRGAFRLQRFSDLALGKTEEILLPSACAALYRRQMIETVGFFDEDFFAYCEDTDLGMRGRLAGWRAVLARDAVVYHKYSQTGGVFSPFKLYLVERNHYWVAFKTYPLTWIMALPVATLLRYLEQVRVVLTSRGTGRQFAVSNSLKAAFIMALVRGVVDALKMLPKMRAKRRKFAAIRRLGDQELGQLLRAYSLSFRELFDAR